MSTTTTQVDLWFCKFIHCQKSTFLYSIFFSCIEKPITYDALLMNPTGNRSAGQTNTMQYNEQWSSEERRRGAEHFQEASRAASSCVLRRQHFLPQLDNQPISSLVQKPRPASPSLTCSVIIKCKKSDVSATSQPNK